MQLQSELLLRKRSITIVSNDFDHFNIIYCNLFNFNVN